jgi:hypothetical protein
MSSLEKHVVSSSDEQIEELAYVTSNIEQFKEAHRLDSIEDTAPGAYV